MIYQLTIDNLVAFHIIMYNEKLKNMFNYPDIQHRWRWRISDAIWYRIQKNV